MFSKSKKVLFIITAISLFSILSFKTIMAADGSGACTVSPSQVIENTDATLTFTFTASETMDGGSVTITIPGGWSAPQASLGTAGYTVGSSTGTIGTLTFSGQTITVPITNLANNQTITIIYGSGGNSSGARVPLAVGQGGSYPITVNSKASAGGTLTAISSLPSITVVARPTIDSSAPVTALLAPIDQETIKTSSYTITGTAIDSGGSTPAWVKVGISSVDSGQVAWNGAAVMGQNYSTWKYEWTDILEGTYTIQAKSADWIGNQETPGAGITVFVSFESEEIEEPEEPEEPEEVEEPEMAEQEQEQEKPISEMTIDELKEKIMEIRREIIRLLTELIAIIQSQIAVAK